MAQRNVIFIFIIFLLLPTALILPAYLFSKSRDAEESPFLLFVHFPAIVFSFLLYAVGIGPHGWENLLEILILAAGGVILAYIKVLIVDWKTSEPELTTYGTVAFLILTAIPLRIFMPFIGE